MMDKVSSSNNNNKCALCGKILSLNKHEKFDTSKEEIIIYGIRYRFDAKDCATMFKRFRSVYGNKFDELLGQEQYISDPFWNTVIPSKKEIREIENESVKKGISC